MKRKLYRTFSTLLVCVVLWGGIGTIQVFASSYVPQISNIPTNVQLRADITEWYYKVIDGKLYKRLFNQTTGEWIGNWTLVK